jgi:tripartite-type tricarboxylate transporter receptor subunit TctC
MASLHSGFRIEIGDGALRPSAGLRLARHARAIAAAFAAALLVAAPATRAQAPAYPDRPIRFILPFAPGGGTDIVGRIIAQKLSEQLGVAVVPENRPGAGSHLGIDLAAKSKPDGYTIVLVAPEFTTGPSLYRKLNYDPTKDFAPISMVAQIAYVMTVGPALPVATLKEFIDYAKANPGKVNYGSPGNGSGPHIAVELLKSITKIDIVHVPYKGAGPAMAGMLGGEVGMTVTASAAALPQVQAGKVKPLVVLSKERTATLASVPTSAEAGYPGWQVALWWGILAPAGTPKDIIDRLNAAWAKAAAQPDTIEKMRAAGFEPLASTPAELADFVRAETARWAGVIKDANIGYVD